MPTRRWLPTRSCSGIPAGRTSSAAPRANARSPSTRTWSGRGGCSISSASAIGPRWRRVPELDPRLASLRRLAIVPAYNEEGSVARVIGEIRSFDPGFEVAVVDDGSGDRTSETAAKHGARVLRLPFNLGIGGSVQTAFVYAHENGFELAIRLDGDGQHDAS